MDLQAKNRTRRVIRVLMVSIAVVLLVIALGIPVANNYVAHGLKKSMEALPLPENTRLVESLSMAGRVQGPGSEMQYFAVLLLESELSREELQNHYSALSTDAENLHERYVVTEQTGQEITMIDGKALAFTETVTDGMYVVYTIEHVSGVLGEFLNLDMRSR